MMQWPLQCCASSTQSGTSAAAALALPHPQPTPALLQRKDSVSAAVILTTFFDNPREAVRVKPWRPPGAAGAAG